MRICSWLVCCYQGDLESKALLHLKKGLQKSADTNKYQQMYDYWIVQEFSYKIEVFRFKEIEAP